jgi:hypothetical protein
MMGEAVKPTGRAFGVWRLARLSFLAVVEFEKGTANFSVLPNWIVYFL